LRIVPGRADITTTRSASCTDSSTSWVTNRIVFFAACQMRSSSERIVNRVIESSAPNGSSRNSMSGSTASARATSTRCFMPPDSSCG